MKLLFTNKCSVAMLAGSLASQKRIALYSKRALNVQRVGLNQAVSERSLEIRVWDYQWIRIWRKFGSFTDSRFHDHVLYFNKTSPAAAVGRFAFHYDIKQTSEVTNGWVWLPKMQPQWQIGGQPQHHQTKLHERICERTCTGVHAFFSNCIVDYFLITFDQKYDII